MKRDCMDCGVEIGRRSKTGRCNRCSCAAVGRTNAKRVERVCTGCGITFLAQPSRKSKYCTRTCYDEHHAPPRGEASPNWLGDNAGRWAHWSRAQRVFTAEPCEECGSPAVRHHIDGDPSNNVRENIRFLCRRHHVQLHYEQGDINISGLRPRRKRSA